MAIGTPVQIGNATATGSATLTYTTTAAAPAGSCIVVYCLSQAGGFSMTSVTDGTNTYSLADTGGSAELPNVAYTANIAAQLASGATITITYGGGTSRLRSACFYITGLTATPLDAALDAHGPSATSTSTLTGPTLAQANEIVLYFFGVNNSITSPSVTGNITYTSLFQDNVQPSAESWYSIVSSTTAPTASASWTNTGVWGETMISMKGASAFTWQQLSQDPEPIPPQPRPQAMAHGLTYQPTPILPRPFAAAYFPDQVPWGRKPVVADGLTFQPVPILPRPFAVAYYPDQIPWRRNPVVADGLTFQPAPILPRPFAAAYFPDQIPWRRNPVVAADGLILQPPPILPLGQAAYYPDQIPWKRNPVVADGLTFQPTPILPRGQAAYYPDEIPWWRNPLVPSGLYYQGLPILTPLGTVVSPDIVYQPENLAGLVSTGNTFVYFPTSAGGVTQMIFIQRMGTPGHPAMGGDGP